MDDTDDLFIAALAARARTQETYASGASATKQLRAASQERAAIRRAMSALRKATGSMAKKEKRQSTNVFVLAGLDSRGMPKINRR